MTTTPPSCARLIVEPVDVALPVDPVVVTFSRATGSAILEGSNQALPYARFSIFACDPVDEYIHRPTASGSPFRRFAERVESYPIVSNCNTPLPFVGGWIGYLTYEAGLTIEGILSTTRRDVALPHARFRLYDAAAIHDHDDGRWYVAAVDWPRTFPRRRLPVKARLARLRTLLASAAKLDPPAPPPEPVTGRPVPNMSREVYLAKVDRAKRYIEAGDIYQVNLTQRFTIRNDASSVDLYRRLRRVSPSSHAAFLPWDDAAIISSSPELFLEVRDGHVVTRPIKGTRPRTGDPLVDAAHRRRLAESGKEQAELNMIIDLLRNDLGRVCSYGTIRVRAAGDIEEHPTVFHRVATIEGDLRPQHGWVDLLLAAFPGGSITGAPKIRAMQIIDELEPTQRGVYCGSIGYVGLDGAMSLNIAIRTMIQTRSTAYVYAGGAIVADSVPEQEYNETIAKATGMFRALGCGPPVVTEKLEKASIS